ncbi:hypothetical protein C5688_12130 [Methylocystis sp. MitZ-2018]|jgi:hypothetical protein|nr:hypothetical protein C5688_12130 [Methylocystis sp. MitZ-2018]
MTTASFFASSPWPRSLWIGSLIVASVLLSPAFHCGFPLAAFAAVAALTLDRRDAFLLSGSVWLASQTIGFVSLHHHMTDVALAWGVATGVIALLSCDAARLAARRVKGLTGVAAAFVAAFVVYKGLIFGFGVAMGSSAGHLDSLLATLPRIFLINACVFAGLEALYALGSAARRNGEAVALAPRHV